MRFIKLSRLVFFSVAFGASVFAHAATESTSLMSFEGFGNIAIQDIEPGGNSFAGGAHYTPRFALGGDFALKPMVGFQTFKSTASTGKKIYVVADLIAPVQYSAWDPITINLGPGLGKDLRSDGKTRVLALLGMDYAMKDKLFGLFDRMIFNAQYVFNSSSLWIAHYGLGVTL